MKKIIAALLFSAISFGTFAQAPLPPPPGQPFGQPANQFPPGATPPLNTPPPPSMPGQAPIGNNQPAPPPAPLGWASPGTLQNPPSADWMNQGSLNVMATGYDSQGVLKQIPLNVSYNFNGVNYNVVVNNAWNPYTESWNMDLDIPANATSYYMNGFTYNYYASLPVGNFYFNL